MHTLRALAVLTVACCALLAPARAEDPALSRVSMRPEGAAFEATIAVPAYVTNDATLATLRTEFGPRALAAGSGANGILVQVVATKEEGAHRASGEWRKEIMKSDEEMQTFESDDIACFDSGEEKGDLKQAHLHAFAVAAGWCFHIEMRQLGDPEDAEFLNRKRFRGMLETFRIASFRRGAVADYPTEVVDQLHAVAMKYPEWKAAADAAVAAKPGEWVPAFVAWQAALAFGAPEADVAAANETAAQLLAKANPADPKARFAWASAEEAIGTALHTAGKYKLAAVRLKNALDVVPTSTGVFRGQIAYGLARAHAKAGVSKDAIAALKTAIESDPSNRERATKEQDFVVMKSRPEFKALVAPPPGK